MQGASTIVAVGNDSTFEEVVSAVTDKDITVGYVPITESEVGQIIGANTIEEACQNLAHRRIEHLDLGYAKGNSFFTYLSLGASLSKIRPQSIFDFSGFKKAAALNPVPVSIDVDGMYTAKFEVAIGAVFNSRAGQKTKSSLANPTDHVLDVLLLPGLTAYDAWKYRNELSAGHLEDVPGCAVIRGQRIRIDGPADWPLFIGERVLGKAPVMIEAIPNKIRMIVGKGRTF
jgi:diacylglycerol kinase family enzyme